eukprot:1379353-Amorphochlora_amoeboformis.AAC.1
MAMLVTLTSELLTLGYTVVSQVHAMGSVGYMGSVGRLKWVPSDWVGFRGIRLGSELDWVPRDRDLDSDGGVVGC